MPDRDELSRPMLASTPKSRSECGCMMGARDRDHGGLSACHLSDVGVRRDERLPRARKEGPVHGVSSPLTLSLSLSLLSLSLFSQ